jgi:hypothetical protein
LSEEKVTELRRRIAEDRERTRRQIAELDPSAEVQAIPDDELVDELWRLEVAQGRSWWQQWWVPSGVRTNGESLYYIARAFQQGAEEPRAAAGLWLIELARTIRRSSSDARARDDELPDNAFPLLLLLVCVARQGNLEAAAVYQLARSLGALNNRVMAEREGFGGTAYLDTRVSEAEGTNTVLPIAIELYQLVNREAKPYLVFFVLSSVLVAAVPLGLIGIAWYATAEGVHLLLDTLFAAPDPLDF